MPEDPFTTAFQNATNNRAAMQRLKAELQQRAEEFGKTLQLHQQQLQSEDAARKAQIAEMMAQRSQQAATGVAEGLFRPAQQQMNAQPGAPGMAGVPGLPATPQAQVNLPGAFSVPGIQGQLAPIPQAERIATAGQAQTAQEIARTQALAPFQAQAAAGMTRATEGAKADIAVQTQQREFEQHQKNVEALTSSLYGNNPTFGKMVVGHALLGIPMPTSVSQVFIPHILPMLDDMEKNGVFKSPGDKLKATQDLMKAIDPAYAEAWQKVDLTKQEIEGSKASAAHARAATGEIGQTVDIRAKTQSGKGKGAAISGKHNLSDPNAPPEKQLERAQRARAEVLTIADPTERSAALDEIDKSIPVARAREDTAASGIMQLLDPNSPMRKALEAAKKKPAGPTPNQAPF